jgi:hypothetical protein
VRRSPISAPSRGIGIIGAPKLSHIGLENLLGSLIAQVLPGRDRSRALDVYRDGLALGRHLGQRART